MNQNNPHHIIYQVSTYTILPPTTDFDFLNEYTRYFKINFHIVHIRISERNYTCASTKLPEEVFPLAESKELCHVRWTGETSIRDLKYTIEQVNFHSLKKKILRKYMHA